MSKPEISVCFDGKTYSLSAVKKAAYRFIDKAAIRIESVDQRILCFLTFDERTSNAERDRIISEFEKEVLDQDLREAIKSETEAVRNLILAHAFSATVLIKE
jgi:His-Xaa-Ser system protein HxsD